MPKCALPPHLKEKKHNDWIWPFSLLGRASNAHGPRCGEGSKGFLPWPPRLVEGYGVARWEMSAGGSVVYIPQLDDLRVIGEEVYGRDWSAIEMNPDQPDFLQEKVVRLIDPRAKVIKISDEPKPHGAPGLFTRVDPDFYSPSALQKFSKSGWLRMFPDYYARWSFNNRKEMTSLFLGQTSKKSEDRVFFYRNGWRPDHVDGYYNGDIIVPVGFIGFKWE